MTDDDLREKKRLQERAERLRTLERLNRLVSSSLDWEDVLGAIARAAADLMATPCVSFWVVDETTRMIRIAAWSDPEIGKDFPDRPRAFGQGAIGRIAETGRPVNVPDVFADDSLVSSVAWWRQHGLTSFYGTPVVFHGRVLAVLALNGRAPFVLSAEDQELLESLVAQAAIAIQNARIFGEAEARRQAAEAAEARYRTLFEHSMAGILRTTRDGRILDVNDALVQILRYPSRDAVLRVSVNELYVDPKEREPIVNGLRTSTRLNNVQFHWRRADGSVATLLANVAVLPDPVEGTILDGILVDVTDRERLEDVERAAETLRAVARLANGAAHEINNPLAVISGHLTLLERKLAHDPDVVARLEKARSACMKIGEIIAHMGRITRLELSDETPGLPPILDLRRSGERAADDPPTSR
ncbi:MAG TPA: GAF domain-containing protein [Terriglobales bacterium]|nr:GAF domain-containing protein [Terriglobales bacterium]